MRGIPREIQQDEAPFNMALATLERLSKILEKIAENSVLPVPLNEMQSNLVNLVKQFYINATPLLPMEVVERYKFVLELKPVSKRIIEARGMGLSESRGVTTIFSLELEQKLYQIIVELQIALQNEKYFMPPKFDITAALKQD